MPSIMIHWPMRVLGGAAFIRRASRRWLSAGAQPDVFGHDAHRVRKDGRLGPGQGSLELFE